MLALGVFFSGCVKDLVCLPRPLSPPLQRISMSGSAKLEYGFPSTHSTNAVSAAMYIIYNLHFGHTDIEPHIRPLALAAGYWFVTSIVVGRLYCGMHGFFDVVIGSALGALIAGLQLSYESIFDAWIEQEGYMRPLVLVIVTLLAVRFHPEPADNCPCFDDSVAFAGVIIGIDCGHWSFSRSSFSSPYPTLGTVPFDFAALGLPMITLRIILGVGIILLWRSCIKSVLLRCLPPLFRQIEIIGLSLPRRFFTTAR